MSSSGDPEPIPPTDMELKQYKLLPAGAQQWHSAVVASGGGRFAYASTLAIYVYNCSTFTLEKVLTGHNQCIAGLSWSRSTPNQFVTVAADLTACVWDTESSSASAATTVRLPNNPVAVDWSPFDGEVAVAMTEKGHYNHRSYTLATFDVSAPDAIRQHFKSSSSEITVVRWNVKKAGLLAAGHADGSLTLVQVRNGKHSTLGAEDRPAVVDMRWDTLSPYYMLVAYKSGDVSLFDMESKSELHGFDRQSSGLVALSWLDFAPGCFATVTQRNGIMRVWNVSQRTPLELVRVSRNGFNGLTFIPGTEQALCSFKDGSVGVFEVGTRQMKFRGSPGHTETIFDVRFRPTDRDTLATSSFDSSIKIWHTPSMTCKETLNGQTGVIYSISWAPDGSDALVSSSSKGSIFMWDTAKGIGKELAIHKSDAAIFRVAWNPRNKDHIVSAGADKTAVLFNPAGEVLSVYRHRAPLYGVSWSPFRTDMFATAAHDGDVRVFSTKSTDPVHVLRGHSKRVFNVVWSPLVADMLASGGDDRSIRVWRVDADEPMMQVLTGHTDNVRALSWNQEVPFWLLSGAWDGTIRVWDVRDGSCLRVISDHYADVYGLDSHPERPFVYVSSSRDTSLRFWTLHGQVDVLKSLAVLNVGDGPLRGAPEDLGPTAEPKLCGMASRRLLDRMRDSKSELDRMADLFGFFYDLDGLSELWNLSKTNIDSTAKAAPGDRIVHARHKSSTAKARAQELEAVRMRRFGSGMGMAKKEDVLQEAADLYLQLGELRKHCDILVELGQWERAISLAPGVSVAYWRSLAESYAEHLAGEDKPGVVSFLTAAHKPQKLVDHYRDRDQLEKALLAVQVVSEGGFEPIRAANEAKPVTTGAGPGSGSGSGSGSGAGGAGETKMDDASGMGFSGSRDASGIALLQAEQYMRRALPGMAACCYTAVGNVDSAVTALLRGGETDLAYALAQVLRADANEATRRMALRLERFGLYDHAVSLMRITREGAKDMALMAARVTGDSAAVEAAYDKAGLRPPSSFRDDAKAAVRAKDVPAAVHAHVMAKNAIDAATMAVKEFAVILSSPSWDLPYAFSLADSMASARLESLTAPVRQTLLVYLAFVAAQRALERKYALVASSLFRAVRAMIDQHDVDFPVASAVMLIQEAQLLFSEGHIREAQKLMERHRITEDMETGKGPDKLAAVEAALAKMSGRIKEAFDDLEDSEGKGVVGSNEVIVSASNLPSGASHSSAEVSVVSGRPVLGPSYAVGTKGLICTRSEAIMWSLVLPFSPMFDGQAWPCPF